MTKDLIYTILFLLGIILSTIDIVRYKREGKDKKKYIKFYAYNFAILFLFIYLVTERVIRLLG